MDSTIGLYVRTGIVGSWAVMVGAALVYVAERILELLTPHESGPGALTVSSVPVFGFLSTVLYAVYNGGAISVLFGILLVFVGWYRLLRLV